MNADLSPAAVAGEPLVEDSNTLEAIPHGRDFSNWNREMRDQVDPDTQARVLLLTEKQFTALRLKELKAF